MEQKTNSANQTLKGKKDPVDPMMEPQEFAVTVRLGRTHFEAINQWSRARFGRENRAGMLAFLINEKLRNENLANGANPDETTK